MTALLTLCLTVTPDDLDALQGTWLASSGVQLTIDGDRATVASPDGYSAFTGRLVLTPTRLRITGDGWAVERRWRTEGGRLWLGGVEYRRALCP